MLKTKPTIKAPIITIIGSAGSGKNSLGGTFPNPVFIQAEDSETVFEKWDEDVMPAFMPRLPAPRGNGTNVTVSTRSALKDQLRWLLTEEHDRKTVIIDTNTALDKMYQSEICILHGVDNIADAAGGFHKGYLVLADWHNEVMTMAQHLRAKGIAVVFLGHQGIKKIKAAPDKDEYSIFSLDLHDAVSSVYVNNSDVVAYIRKETHVQGKETDRKGKTTKYGRLIDTGRRQLVTSGDGQTGFYHAKTRYDMPAVMDLPVGENPLLEHIKFFGLTPKQD